MRQVLLAIILLFSSAGTAAAGPLLTGTSAGMNYRVEELASGFDRIWGLAFWDETTLLFTEKSGSLHRLDLGSGAIEPIAGIPDVWARNQGGLLDLAVYAGREETPWVYFTFSKPDGSGNAATALARARLGTDRLEDWQELLVTKSVTGTGRHFGSRITFDDSGHLFFTVGDRGERPNGQNLNTHAGSILRLHADGTVPADNPFVSGGGLPEIWSYGHRNPQGIFYDHATGRLWSNEHGPRGGDEINLIEPGVNYGWPVVSHGKEYWGPMMVGEALSKPGMRDPIKVYIPSIAPGSLIVYSGKAFPAWRGNLLAGALAMVHLNRVVLDDSGAAVEEERLLLDLDERIRDVAERPDGSVFLSTDSGRILVLSPEP